MRKIVIDFALSTVSGSGHMEQIEKIKEPRVNISIVGDHAENIELLRSLLEKRLMQRLSIAQVIKRLALDALLKEKELATVSSS